MWQKHADYLWKTIFMEYFKHNININTIFMEYCFCLELFFELMEYKRQEKHNWTEQLKLPVLKYKTKLKWRPKPWQLLDVVTK